MFTRSSRSKKKKPYVDAARGRPSNRNLVSAATLFVGFSLNWQSSLQQLPSQRQYREYRFRDSHAVLNLVNWCLSVLPDLPKFVMNSTNCEFRQHLQSYTDACVV